MVKRNGILYPANVLLIGLFFLCFSEVVSAATCLKNNTSRTLYVDMQSGEDGQIGNMLAGGYFCIDVKKSRKAVAKVYPYGGARMGCKVVIPANKTYLLQRFGTLNNCKFVPQK